MPTAPTQLLNKVKDAVQGQTQSTGRDQEAGQTGRNQAVEQDDNSWVKQDEISWNEVDKMEQQARKEREQDEPTLKANARRASDAMKERQNSM
ncbi:hypothetical protein INT43_000157 [Umbelopsis isabellina]|uniref:Uncharacterized protein n=1 Tax=Mortierella isabellina TaxID=91625 RepID=A0A8H7PFN2_MORIS|nr:hypothetical protein INT43_000157 [Umbelopsis isabellina]